MGTLRVGLIGCGGRGRRTHLPILRSFPDVRLVALCDVRPDAAATAGQEFEVEHRFADVDEMLDAVAVDAVFVATSIEHNAPTALQCLRRGIPTLLEKPAGTSVADAEALRDAAGATPAMVGWNRRFHPMVVEARERIAARGPATQIVGEFHKSIAQIAASGMFSERMLDLTLLDSPIHAVDLICALADSPVRKVHAVVRRAASRYRDVHAALVEFESGCVAQFTANYTTDARLERYEIHGCGISAYLEGITHGEMVHDGGRHPLAAANSDGTREQNRYFLDCVKQGRLPGPPAAGLAEAVETMRLAEAILAATRE